MWVDLTRQLAGGASLCEQLTPFCDIRPSAPPRGQSHSSLPGNKPDVVVFEYDYPDMDSLHVLRATREQFPDMPIVMFTLHHSEELAVWALRNRVWDYYYKPLTTRQINEIGLSLQQWHRQRSTTTARPFLGNGYPDEVRFHAASECEFDTSLATNYVEQHLGEKICEDTLATLYGLSRFQFSRQFKKATATTFQNFVVTRRIERAKVMLKNPAAQVIDIAFAVGFSDAAYFTKTFKRVTGVLPSQLKTSCSR